MKIFQPRELNECLALLAELSGGQTVILSGGTDLMPRFEQGRPLPDNLINIKYLADIQGITANEEGVVVGGLTTIEALRQSEIIHENFPALWQATTDFAGVQIRNRATLAGNIANASPAADTLPALYLYHARIHLVSLHAARTIRLVDFIEGPGRTILEPGELIHSVILPQPTGVSRFYKLGLRDAMAIAVASYAIRYNHSAEQITDLEITAGAVAPTIVFLDTLTEMVLAHEENPVLWDQAIQRDIAPIDDVRATAKYRRKVLSNLIVHELQHLQVGAYE